MIRRPPRSTRTDTLFPTRRSSDLRIRRTWTTFLFLLVMHEWNVASLTPSYSSGPCVPDVDVVTHDLARTPPWPHERTCRHPQEPVRLHRPRRHRRPGPGRGDRLLSRRLQHGGRDRKSTRLNSSH